MKAQSNSSLENSFKHETLICKRCGQSFECKVGDISRCQCTAVEISKKTVEFLETTMWGCLCVSCLKEIDSLVQSLKDESFPTPSEMREGFHFYIENGLYVFTEGYHSLRGYCCESGCRHCPFGFKKSSKPDDTNDKR